MSRYLLFDIGGTTTRVAVSHDGVNIAEPVIYSTPQSYSLGIKQLVKVAKELSSQPYDKIGGGIAGPMNEDKSGIINAPNLPDWNWKPLQKDIRAELGGDVILENDTAMVGLGEAVKGAGKDHNIVVYITISTGVNGARIVNKKLDAHHFGFEIGKQLLDIETETSWEKMIIYEDNTVEKEAELIAYGVFNSVLFWSPEIIVLGGGRMKRIEISNVQRHLDGLLKIYPELPKVVKSELGEVGGVYGALEFLNSQ